MKKIVVPLLKKIGEKIAETPVYARSVPALWNQPDMPDKLNAKMKDRDK